MNTPIEITAQAAQRVKQLLGENNQNQDKKPSKKQEKHLRVYITGGGCSGFQYGFAFEEKPKANDIVIEKEGVGFLVDAISLQYLQGSVVDFEKSLMGARFIVQNPNAKTTCGCGSSFSI